MIETEEVEDDEEEEWKEEEEEEGKEDEEWMKLFTFFFAWDVFTLRNDTNWNSISTRIMTMARGGGG